MADRDLHLTLADDEALSALIDGALAPANAEALRKRLANDSKLAARLATLENADTALRTSYSSVVDEPVPDEILALLQPRRGGADVIALSRWQQWWMPSALAASIALAVGLAIGVPLGQLRGDASGEMGLTAATSAIRPGSGLYAVLDSVPSGETQSLGRDVSATPHLTFRTTAGAYCRQIRISAIGGRTDALACREDDAWTLRATAFEARKPTGDEAGVYQPAGGAVDALDATIDILIDGQPLSRQAEVELITRHWAGE